MAALDYEKLTYADGSGFRTPLNDLVYTASDEPAEFTIEHHNEMSNTRRYPSKVNLTLRKGQFSKIRFKVFQLLLISIIYLFYTL